MNSKNIRYTLEEGGCVFSSTFRDYLEFGDKHQDAYFRGYNDIKKLLKFCGISKDDYNEVCSTHPRMEYDPLCYIDEDDLDHGTHLTFICTESYDTFVSSLTLTF